MDREQIAEKCVRIEKAGGSVLDFLRGCGCISPWGTWYRLQREELRRDRKQITDGKGGKDMRKITLSDKKKAVDIAIGGGNPLVFLKECGSKNPSAAWYAIKQTLKETDPETFAKLTDLRKKEEEPTAGDAMDGIKDAAEELFSRCEEMGMKITKPVNHGGFEMLAIRDPENGNVFSYDPRAGVLEWRTEAGDEVIMHPDHWRDLAEKIPQALQILGI